MMLRLTSVEQGARSALDCGPAVRDRLAFERKVRRLTDTALQGAFRTTIFMAVPHARRLTGTQKP